MIDFEKLVPGLAEARAIERTNRALAFAGITHRVCGVEIRPLTPRARLELQITRNAFTTSAEPLAGDVFEFVWINHPERRKLSGTEADLAQKALGDQLRARPLADNVREIREYLVQQLQDMPGRGLDDSDRTDHGPWIHWAAQDAGFWISVHGGFTLESYMETPMLVLQQLYRAWCVNNPEVVQSAGGKVAVLEPSFVNNSDWLYSAWLRERRVAATELIKAQRHRLS